MSFEVVSYEDALAEAIVSVFNAETDRLPFVVPLTGTLFREQIAAKSLFDPEGCSVAMANGKAVGFALACQVKSERVEPGNIEGAIDGVFCPLSRPDVGHALIRACVQRLQGQGAEVIWGFASGGGYPFWRGLYCGAEPVCQTVYVQGWAELLRHGFAHHQQSVNYLGEPREMSYRQDLEYVVEDLELSHPWASDSWRGHRPKELIATLEGSRIGRIGFVDMPFLSDYRGKKVFGIYDFGVEETHRRKRVGSSLFAKLWEITGDLDAREVLVATTVENAPARRIYENAGMRPVGGMSGVAWRAAIAPGQ